MKLFNLSLQGMVLRFYLMMAVVLIAGFTGTWAIALLALPIFFSGMVGMSLFSPTKKGKTAKIPAVKMPIESSNITSLSSMASA